MADYVIPRHEWPIFYRQSADKQYAIKVLADVTLLPRKAIEDALIADGCAVKRRKPYKPPNYNFDTATAMAMYEARKTDTEIADALKVHKTTVWNWRISKGLPVNSERKPATRIDEYEALRLYELGFNDIEIGQQIGVSPPSICRWRKRRGLKTNYEYEKGETSGRASASGD